MLRLLEASSMDRKAYRESLAEILDGLDRFNIDADKETIRIFSELRRDIAGQIAELGDSPSAALYQRSLEGIDEAMTGFANRWGIRFDVLQQAGFQIGTELATTPIETGLDQTGLLSFVRGGPSIDQLRILTLFRTDLVGGLTQELHKRIRMEITGVAAGAKTAGQAADAIGRNLTDANHFTTIAHRARAIVVTEVGRAQSLGTQYAQTEAAKVVPGLRKSWLNAHLPGARETHIAAENRYREGGLIGPIEVDEPFAVAGFDALYPRDPSLPAKETVHCHCVSISVIVDSAVTPEPVDPAAPEPEPLTPPDAARQEDDLAQLPAREVENRARYERLKAPLEKPAGWSKMANTKRLRWLEDQMEADWPIGEEFRTEATITKTELVEYGSRKRRRNVSTREPRTPGDDLPTTFDLAGMDADTVFGSMNQLRGLAVAFPEVAEQLAYVGGYRGAKAAEWKIRTSGRGGQFRGEYAHASVDGRRLALAPSWYADATKMSSHLNYDWEQGFHPIGGIESVITHEWGHHVQSWIRRNANQTFVPGADPGDGFGTVGNTFSLLEKEFARGGPDGPGGYIDISRYGLKSGEEAFAETFVVWWYRRHNQTFPVLAQATNPITGTRIAGEIEKISDDLPHPAFADRYDKHGVGERWLDRIGRYWNLLYGTRVANLPSVNDFPIVPQISETALAEYNRLRDQLLSDLGGEFGSIRYRGSPP